MYKHQLLIAFLVLFFKSYGDMGPKHSESIYIQFKQNTTKTHLDSLYVIVINSNHADTAFLPPYTTAQFWTGPTLKQEKDRYELFTHGSITCFKIVGFIDHRQIESNFIANYPGNSVYHMAIETHTLVNTDIHLIDDSTLFHQDWGNYLTALLITICIELLLGISYFNQFKTHQRLSVFLMLLTLINVLTHFCLWLVYAHYTIPLFFLELCVALVEAIFWKVYFRISIPVALRTSMILNLVSWAIGAIAALMIG